MLGSPFGSLTCSQSVSKRSISRSTIGLLQWGHFMSVPVMNLLIFLGIPGTSLPVGQRIFECLELVSLCLNLLEFSAEVFEFDV